MDGMLLLCINLFLTRDSFVLSSEASTETLRSGAEFEKSKKSFCFVCVQIPPQPHKYDFQRPKITHTSRTS